MSEIDRKILAAGAPFGWANLLLMRSSIVRLAVAALLIGALPGVAYASPAPLPASSACAATKLVNLHTLHIEATPSKKVYRRGETIVIDVEVTRPAEEDPGGNGVPMERPT